MKIWQKVVNIWNFLFPTVLATEKYMYVVSQNFIFLSELHKAYKKSNWLYTCRILTIIWTWNKFPLNFNRRIVSRETSWCPKRKLTYRFYIYLHSNYYWLNIKGCAYQRTNFSMSKLSKSLCNVMASQISHQKQSWSEKIIQMSEMY